MALDPQLVAWLAAQADGLDTGSSDPEAILARLADAGLPRIGVPQALGGSGGDTGDAILAIAEVAAHSLTAAFILWGQRTFIEYLLQSPNAGLRERLLPRLFSGDIAGATGLSNAMKHLCGIEALQVKATPRGDRPEEGWTLDGHLPWVTNLRRQGFVFALAADDTASGKPAIFALPDNIPGVRRSEDLDLIALRSSNTAALDMQGVAVGAEWLIHDDARRFLPAVRPAFLGLQCGMSIGHARAGLAYVAATLRSNREVLRAEWQQLTADLETQQAALLAGVADGRFEANPAALFQLRIRLAEIAAAAIGLELQARGGAAYLHSHTDGFLRRWREAAFVPVVTPSLLQLKTELGKQAVAA